MEAMLRAAAAAALAAVALAGGASARTADVVISVISTATSAKAHDAPPKGASAGDSIVMTDRLTNAVRQLGKAKGAVVGADRATERLVSRGNVSIDGITRLPGGTVHVKGRLRADAQGRATAPVVSGTGKYEGATGTLTIVNLNRSGNLALNIYQLTLLPVT
jgi:hypothetical protein